MKARIKKYRGFEILAAITLSTVAFFVLIGAANAADYVYKQEWMPKER